MVAHGVPVVPPSPAPVAVPSGSTTNHEYIESTATNLVDTVLKITKEASEMFKDVPYIKAFAGVLIQIVNIREVRELFGERNGGMPDSTRRKFKLKRTDLENSLIRSFVDQRSSSMDCSELGHRRTGIS
jgi:hypothetical protein